MLYCQSESLDHRARAAYALTFTRDDARSPVARVLACAAHAAQAGAGLGATDGGLTERYGLSGRLTLASVDDVFEQRVVVPLTREAVERSPLSPVMVAYDRACQAARDRGLAPISTYRLPVQWRQAERYAVGADRVEAHVTLAVTLAASTPDTSPADEVAVTDRAPVPTPR